MPDRRARARELAAEFIRKGDPIGWFEVLYQEAQEGKSEVPWADQRPAPHLIDFWKAHPLETAGKSALVIASGLGDDAEQLAAWGFKTTGFDISKTAIEATKKRFSKTAVEYVVADLFDPPSGWSRNFDFVFESNTLQALPAALRPPVIEKIAQFVKPGGSLLVIARGREKTDPEGQLPWPLTRDELGEFVRVGLREESFEDFADPEPPWVRRFRVLYKRPKLAR
ncbi:MAG: class I SAM-dependent methyltransferase [Candidatus Acidiferrales bacterium]|jgi:SAM-dependent methyltransferase